ncbi:MAG: ATP-dependent DNA helicase RecG [Holosporaceae bacterium]|jgi:ATP-dependent DNA helicase RecG|nr:ATP-dependent DNA helicase RecG [Holosporaceae bacterium]
MKASDFLFSPVTDFVKISDHTIKLLKKCCGGYRVIDLLLHFPSSIQNRTTDVDNFSDKDKLTLVVQVMEHVAPAGKSHPYKIIVAAGTLKLQIIYFNYNAYYLHKTFPIGETLCVSGNAQRTIGGLQIIHPDIVTQPSYAKYHVGVEAIYPLTAGLSNKTLSYAIATIFKNIPEIPEHIPPDLLNKYKLMKFHEAIWAIHHPKNIADIVTMTEARQRIAVDELLANQIRLRQIRETMNEHRSKIIRENGKITGRLKLPFKLTRDQIRCLNDIKKDLASPDPMNRLVQGDVGAGKTVVAFLSMLLVIENGFQAVLLAPTEILAMQHYSTLKNLSENLGINIDIMLGSNRRKRPLQIENLKNNSIQLLVGTHAILEDNIEFANLGLVVIDEQHRFGVLQRVKLIKKCQNSGQNSTPPTESSGVSNVLAMSATPIPRTLLLGCYGDLNVSTIKTKPAGRKPIETMVFNVSKIGELTARLRESDSQIYWVCPVIEESEALMDITTRCEYLNNIFSASEVRILHGKMKPQEKNSVINDFKNKKFKLLVSTTVIEVGVDIPSANVMVIEHAERFGLAQLHQLRGRVGRGSDAAYCILLYHHPVSKIGQRRLQLMRETNDGFLLSEEDLKLRGAGDILGKEQSGFNSLRFSEFTDNYSLLKMAEEIANALDLKSENTAVLCDMFNRIENDTSVFG